MSQLKGGSYVTNLKIAVFGGSYVTNLKIAHIHKPLICKSLKKATFSQGIGSNPLFAIQEQPSYATFLTQSWISLEIALQHTYIALNVKSRIKNPFMDKM